MCRHNGLTRGICLRWAIVSVRNLSLRRSNFIKLKDRIIAMICVTYHGDYCLIGLENGICKRLETK